MASLLTSCRGPLSSSLFQASWMLSLRIMSRLCFHFAEWVPFHWPKGQTKRWTTIRCSSVEKRKGIKKQQTGRKTSPWTWSFPFDAQFTIDSIGDNRIFNAPWPPPIGEINGTLAPLPASLPTLMVIYIYEANFCIYDRDSRSPENYIHRYIETSWQKKRLPCKWRASVLNRPFERYNLTGRNALLRCCSYSGAWTSSALHACWSLSLSR